MDKRPMLKLIDGGLCEPPPGPGVCRQSGCAELPGELGFCDSCRGRYAFKIEQNRDRYAVLVGFADFAFDFGALDPFVHRLLAAEFVNAITAQRYSEAVALLGGEVA